MKTLFRLAVLAFLILPLTAAPSFAKTVHHKAHHHIHKKKHVKAKKKLVNATVKEAQAHLASLGYLEVKDIDGLMGPKTRAALVNFQRSASLPLTGETDDKTIDALRNADRSAAKAIAKAETSDFTAEHPDFYGYYDQNYADPLVHARGDAGTTGVSQALPNRFTQMSVTEDASGAMKHYKITLNGTPVLEVNNQPSVIGISRTYQLGDEDAVILSTFADGNNVCPYKHYLLTLRQSANELHPVGNCTRGYQATVANNSLFIVFPETDDGRVAGSTWRYDNGRVEKL